MKKSAYLILFVLIIVCFFVVIRRYSSLAGEKEAYVLSSHLKQATAVLLSLNGAEKNLHKNSFFDSESNALKYDSEPKWMSIERKSAYFQRQLDKKIFFHPKKSYIHRIAFPIGSDFSEALLIYGFSDAVDSAPHKAGVLFRVLMGDKVLLSEQVKGVPDLVKSKLDLTDASGPFLVEIELLSETDGWHHFYFDGVLYEM